MLYVALVICYGMHSLNGGSVKSARIEPATSPHPPEIAAMLERLTPPGTTTLALFRTVARDPRLWARFTCGGLLDRGHLTLREREIISDRTTARCGSAYEWGVRNDLRSARRLRRGADSRDRAPACDRGLLVRRRPAAHRDRRCAPGAVRSRRRALGTVAEALLRRGDSRNPDAGRVLPNGELLDQRLATRARTVRRTVSRRLARICGQSART